MKGGLAAACLAIRAIRNSGLRLKGNLQLHAVVGEETMSHEIGTSAVLRAGYRADAAIVVEPSSQPEPLTIGPVSDGNFNLRISVQGRGTHAGNRAATIRAGGEGDSAGVNAVEKLIKIVIALQDLEQEWGISKRHPAFPAAFSRWCRASFMATLVCRASAISRTRPMSDISYGMRQTRQRRRSRLRSRTTSGRTVARLDPWLRYNPPCLEWLSDWPAADIPADHPIVGALVSAREKTLGPQPAGLPKTSSFNAVCDASFLQAEGIPVVTFGPGNIRFAHAVDENIDITEWFRAAKILADAIIDWCGVAN